MRCATRSRDAHQPAAYVLPRQIAMYIARQLTWASLEEIGREFGGRHHTSVLYAVSKIERMRRSDGALDSAIGRLMDDIALHLGSSSNLERK